MKKFYELTQRGRALRLRKMALKALESYDFKPTQVSLITNETNGIFRVDTEDRQKVILRITTPRGCHCLDEIRSEMNWLETILLHLTFQKIKSLLLSTLSV